MKLKASRRFIPLFLFAVFAVALPLAAQQSPASSSDAAQPLPSAPTPALTLLTAPLGPQQLGDTQNINIAHPPQPAPRLAKYIQHGQRAQTLTAMDKLELAGWEQVQPYAFGTEILAAGWEHLIDSAPQYGSDSAGFGERFGAAVIRQSSQAIFSDGVLPAVLHQDPRYYRKGSGTIRSRILYAATRVLVIRTDAGTEAPNYSQIFGYAGASALTMTYYPAVNATWGDAASGYVVSMLTSALGNQVHEFEPDLIKRLRRWHHKHPE